MGKERKKGKPFRKSRLEWGRGCRAWLGRVSKFRMWSLGRGELWSLRNRERRRRRTRTMLKVCDVRSG